MSLPPLPYYLINAFTTDSPHTGNQAAVVIFPTPDDPREADDAYKFKVAKDFGFAETAYLVPLSEDHTEWGLRWFTPEVVSFGTCYSRPSLAWGGE
jgi:predicted PhzF superfamily epimerase YddE/YHI9